MENDNNEIEITIGDCIKINGTPESEVKAPVVKDKNYRRYKCTALGQEWQSKSILGERVSAALCHGIMVDVLDQETGEKQKLVPIPVPVKVK